MCIHLSAITTTIACIRCVFLFSLYHVSFGIHSCLQFQFLERKKKDFAPHYFHHFCWKVLYQAESMSLHFVSINKSKGKDETNIEKLYWIFNISVYFNTLAQNDRMSENCEEELLACGEVLDVLSNIYQKHRK